MKLFFKNIFTTLLPYRFRLLGLLAGLIIAILLLTIGFFKTLLIVFLMTVGYIAGYFFDDKIDFGNIMDKIMSRVKGDK